MKKVLGLDLGSRTCGIAMSDILGMIAHGVETFRFKPDDYLTCAKHVKEIVEENEIETIVLGLPKHMNGDIGERGQISIEFKKQLEEMIEGINVILVDERLTTVVAENQLLFADVSRKKRKQVIDKMAAVQYVVYFDPEKDEPEAQAAIFDDEGGLFPIETPEEWELVEEVFQSFVSEEDEDETEYCEGEDEDCNS